MSPQAGTNSYVQALSLVSGAPRPTLSADARGVPVRAQTRHPLHAVRVLHGQVHLAQVASRCVALSAEASHHLAIGCWFQALRRRSTWRASGPTLPPEGSLGGACEALSLLCRGRTTLPHATAAATTRARSRTHSGKSLLLGNFWLSCQISS